MRSTALLSGITLQPGTLRAVLLDRLTRSLGKDPESATQRDIYDALSLAVREELAARWLSTQRRISQAGVKRVCYLSVEYLLGRSLINGLASLDGDLVQEAREALAELGYDLERVAQEENDPGLGNGGLGRLAACFLDSLATLQYPAVGYGIRYDYGIFTQVIDEDGRQREIASTWMRERSPWEIARDDARYVVSFGGRCIGTQDAQGRTRYRWVETHNIWAVGFDQLIPGNRSPTVNHLRLWAGRAIAPFNVEVFNAGRHVEASTAQAEAKNVSRILYPDDTTPQGKELRFKQQYFFVSASLQDMLAQHLAEGRSFDSLHEALSIQLNDTHPALAITELIRLLVDEHEVEWEQAWKITRRVFSYTNHTLLPEALEVWPVAFFERILPRHLQIIYLINRAFLDEVTARWPGDNERRSRMSLIDEGGGRQVRMANLAVVASHTVNGVAKLHSELMTKTIFADFAELYPGRFTNVTNGIAVRRWLKQSNLGLSSLITRHLGHAWENDLEELERIRGMAEDAGFRREFREIKLANKRRLDAEVQRRVGIDLDVHSLFDVQVKRIHEYKRQLLNLLYVVTRYHKLRANPDGVRRAAHGDLRGQGGAGLRDGQGHHQAHQQRRQHRQRGRIDPGQAEGRLPARLRRLARAADHACCRPVGADLDRGSRGLRHGQHEAFAERRAHHRHARRRQHRDPRTGRCGEHLHLRPAGARSDQPEGQGLRSRNVRRLEPRPRAHARHDRFGLLLARQRVRRQADRRAPALRRRTVLRAGGFRGLRQGAG